MISNGALSCCSIKYTSFFQLSIWDTAGVERFRTLTRNYYRNAHAAVFVYSVADASSLHYLSQWIKDTQNFAPNAVRMLLGNKIDIEPLEVDELTSKSFAKAHEFDLHFEISCKTPSGINQAFEKLGKALHKPSVEDKGAKPVQANPTITVTFDSNGVEGGRCVC